jgi:hypothetical protein
LLIALFAVGDGAQVLYHALNVATVLRQCQLVELRIIIHKAKITLNFQSVKQKIWREILRVSRQILLEITLRMLILYAHLYPTVHGMFGFAASYANAALVERTAAAVRAQYDTAVVNIILLQVA